MNFFTNNNGKNFLVTQIPDKNQNLAQSNKVFFCPTDQFSEYVEIVNKSTNTSFVYKSDSHDKIESGFIAINTKQREIFNAEFNKEIFVKSYNNNISNASIIKLHIESPYKMEIDCQHLTDILKQKLQTQPLSTNQQFIAMYSGKILNFVVLSITTENNKNSGIALLNDTTDIVYSTSKSFITLSGQQLNGLFKSGQSLNNLGVGGLGEQTTEMFVKAFSSRVDTKLSKELGITHTRGILLYGPPGCGKCLGINTPILMYDGSIKLVQDIVVGDLLMGDDSTPRTVMSLARGQEQMYKIRQHHGDDYVVNESHILSLQTSENNIIDIELKEYLNLDPQIQKTLKGYKVSVEFPKQDLQIDPYITGILLAATNCVTPINNLTDNQTKTLNSYLFDCCLKNDRSVTTSNIHFCKILNSQTIPLNNKINSVYYRSRLLAGILDLKGDISSDKFCYLIVRNTNFLEDILFLIRSLGLMCDCETVEFCDCLQTIIKISGHSFSELPCNVFSKLSLNLDQNLLTDIKVAKLNIDDYFGFEISGNRRFLLGDFTVTHNTLLAKGIAKVLNCVEPIIINGPELLDKYHGESERKVRELFAPAMNDSSENLHVIIIDEVDALCKSRGSGSSVGDNIVNQFLTMIDGPKSLNNILLIFMTNRKDLIDDAILRPGRIELHIEINLPNINGREEILYIHTKSMKESKHLDTNVSISDIAKLTENFTGAELAKVAKDASLFALSRKFTVLDGEVTNDKNAIVCVTMDDFINAVDQINPMFGRASNEIQIINSTPFIFWTEQLQVIHNDILTKITNLCNGNIATILIVGMSYTGKTKFVANVVKSSKIPCVKIISIDKLLRSSLKSTHIINTFEVCLKASNSILILDGFERLIEWINSGPRFNNEALQTIIAILTSQISLTKKITIICTAQNENVLDELGLTDLFDTKINYPSIISSDELVNHFPDFSDIVSQNTDQNEFINVASVFKLMKYAKN